MSTREHNLVNLLHAIKAVLDSHEMQVREGYFKDSETQKNHAEWALKQAKRQAEKALNVAKRLNKAACSSELEKQFEKVASLQDAWERVMESLQSECLIQRVEKVIRIPENFPLLACDSEDLEEILQLLVQNSIQAAELEQHLFQTKLIVRAELGFSSAQEPVALITLADTGPGISKETLSHLFHPFYTTKPDGEGNGLGLYLVKSLVAKNHGRVSVSSFEQCGTTFAIELPLAASKINC